MTITPQTSATVGVDIGGTKMHMLAHHNGRRFERRVPTGRDYTPEALRGALDAFIAELPFAPRSVGMAVPGLVEGDSKIVISNPIPALGGVDAAFFGRGRYAVRFCNDVAAAAMAEAAVHSAARTLLVILIGTYIGMGVCVNGKLLMGSRGWGNDLGFHVINTADGVKRVNDVCGGAAILAAAGCSAEAMQNRLAAGDGEAQAVITQAAKFFGYALSNALHLYNPDVAIIGGGTSYYPGYYETALATAKAWTLPPHWDCCVFARPYDPERIAALGAMAFGNSGRA